MHFLFTVKEGPKRTTHSVGVVVLADIQQQNALEWSRVARVTFADLTSTRTTRGSSDIDALPVHSQGRSKKDNTLCGSRGFSGHSAAKRPGMESRQHPYPHWSPMTHTVQFKIMERTISKGNKHASSLRTKQREGAKHTGRKRDATELDSGMDGW
jgi:hypothetical protein